MTGVVSAPRQGDERRRDSVDRFNRSVARIFTIHRAPPPVHFMLALESGQLLAWPQYTEVLFALDLTQDDRQRIKSEYEAVAAGSIRPRHVEVAPSNSEYQAADGREFALLLKAVQLRSGLTLSRIGELAGIPRSQAYSMVARGTLPTRFRQVVRFVEVCGLPAADVRRIMRLWLELRQRGHDSGQEKGDVLWDDYLEYLGRNSRGAADGPGQPWTASRRLDEMLKITRGVRVARSATGRRLDGR